MWANIYDAAILFALWVVIALPFGIYFVAIQHHPASPILQNILHASWPILGLGYFVYYWTKNGQTLGMQAWRLQVRATKGPLSLSRATLRYLLALLWFVALIAGLLLAFYGRYLLALPPLILFSVAYLWILWDPQGQALHDRLTGTRVFFLPKLANARQKPATE
jgi:uncharacterized RDD family membrane protein YckC